MSELDDMELGEGGDSVLAAEFVLGLMPAEEHAQFAARVSADPVLRAEVTRWRRQLGGLDAAFEPAPAPASAWSDISARLFPDAPRQGWWNSLAVWRGLAGAAVATAVVAVGLNVLRPAAPAPEEFAAQLVAALQSQDSMGVEFVALYDERTGMVKLVGVSGQDMPDRDFELWYIKDNQPAVSMGVIPAMSRMDMPLDTAARAAFDEGTVLAITLEPKGGSPSGVATGPVVSMGKATSI